MELARKIAYIGRWNVDFNLREGTGKFIFFLIGYNSPQGTLSMTIGFHDIILKLKMKMSL